MPSVPVGKPKSKVNRTDRERRERSIKAKQRHTSIYSNSHFKDNTQSLPAGGNGSKQEEGGGEPARAGRKEKMDVNPSLQTVMPFFSRCDCCFGALTSCPER